MDQEELMIKVDHVTKQYKLGVIGPTTLQDELRRRRAKRLHLEDPTLKIGKKAVAEDGYFNALSDLSLEVGKGETLGIIGHNGAGKSTLLKLITKITRPTYGNIYLYGHVSSMLEVGTGFHADLTGRENVYLNGAILGMKKKEIDAKMESIIEFSELRDFMDTPVKRYSSGMYIKLAFAVAAHLDSEIVIMDEVLAVGDIAYQNKCIEKMKEIAESGRTILYVSHNMSTIQRLCKRCIVLEHGHMIYDGDVNTAIGLYMKQNDVRESSTSLDTKIRLHNGTNLIHMLNYTAADREQAIYRMGEKISFDLKFRSEQYFDDLRMRIGIWSSECEAISFSLTDAFSAVPGSNNHVRVELDTSELLAGKYSLELLVVQADSSGNMIKHDGVRYASFFEIIMDETKPVFKNYNRDWGKFTLQARVIEQ